MQGWKKTVRHACRGVVVIAFAVAPASASASDYVVGTSEDRDSVPCLPDVGDCSLREALLSTAASPAADVITFDLPTGSMIAADSPFPQQPAEGGPLTIDGMESGGCDTGEPSIDLDGTGASAGAGLDLAGQGSKVCGIGVYGWSDAGIRLAGADGVVTDSFVGASVGGAETGIGNGGDGIVVDAPGAVVGRPGGGNVIVGNGGSGVLVTALGGAGTVISANTIGTEAGATPNPNYNGVRLLGDGTTVGGTTDGTGNLIARNLNVGIEVTQEAQNNPLLRNVLYDNTNSNIGLRPSVIFGDDPLDPDEGGNRLQNRPGFQRTFLAASNSLYSQVYPDLSSAPNETFRIEYFTNETKDCGVSGGQTLFTGPSAEHFLGAVDIRTDENGNTYYGDLSFEQDPVQMPPATPGEYLSGTATDSEGNTSRIGGCSEINEIPLPEVDAEVVPVDGSGQARLETVCPNNDFDCSADLRLDVGGRAVGRLRKVTVPGDGEPHVSRISLTKRATMRLRRSGRLRGSLAISSVGTKDGSHHRIKLIRKRRHR